MKDSYELAVVAYALAVSGSAKSDLAYRALKGAMKEEGGMIYWSRSNIETNKVRYEFNRPFLEAKSYQEDDALAVEATGYALLTMFRVEGGGVTVDQGRDKELCELGQVFFAYQQFCCRISFQNSTMSFSLKTGTSHNSIAIANPQDKIVQWLNTMRLGDGGFISTVDTIVAMEALVTYSYNSRIKDLTDLTVEVDIPDSNLTHPFHITGQNIAKLQRIEIPNVWGHINLVANGAGQAIAQLDVNWGVDYEPFKVIHRTARRRGASKAQDEPEFKFLVRHFRTTRPKTASTSRSRKTSTAGTSPRSTSRPASLGHSPRRAPRPAWPCSSSTSRQDTSCCSLTPTSELPFGTETSSVQMKLAYFNRASTLKFTRFPQDRKRYGEPQQERRMREGPLLHPRNEGCRRHKGGENHMVSFFS